MGISKKDLDYTAKLVGHHTRTRGYKTSFMLNSAQLGIFSANKYENMKMPTINGISILIRRELFHAQLCLAGKNLQLLVI